MNCTNVTLPVITGLYADPDLVCFNGTYYIYPTTDGFDGWSGTEFYVFSSKDGAHFQKVRKILDVSTDVPWSVGSAWAPCCICKNERYHFFFCAKRPDGISCIGVAHSDRPDGGFVADAAPLITPEMMNCKDLGLWQVIDPSVYEENGTCYLLFGNGAPMIAELSDDLSHILSETIQKIEGAFDFRESIIVTKRENLYHFTWSCDDTGSENYHVNYGTAPCLTGPITYHYPILEKQGDSLGTGHHSILRDKDGYVIAFHRFATPLDKYPEGKGFHRETCLSQLKFDENGKMLPVKI